MSLFAACTGAAWRLAALPFGFATEHFGAPYAAAGGAAMLVLVLVPIGRGLLAEIS